MCPVPLRLVDRGSGTGYTSRVTETQTERLPSDRSNSGGKSGAPSSGMESGSHEKRRTLLGVRVPDRDFLQGLFGSYRRMLVFAGPYWKKLAIAGVILVISSLLSLALPLAIGGVVNASFVE